MRALDPVNRVRKLTAALIRRIKHSKVVPHEKRVWQVQIRLPGYAREIRMAPRILGEGRVSEVGRQLRSHAAYQSLIPQVVVVAAAGCSDSSAVQGIANKDIQIARILNVVSQHQPMVFTDLVVDSDESSVAILSFQLPYVFGGDSQDSFSGVD